MDKFDHVFPYFPSQFEVIPIVRVDKIQRAPIIVPKIIQKYGVFKVSSDFRSFFLRFHPCYNQVLPEMICTDVMFAAVGNYDFLDVFPAFPFKPMQFILLYGISLYQFKDSIWC